MANPAILAGLIAGYTVGAVVTALAVAHDDQSHDLPLRPALLTSTRGVCARMAHTPGIERCVRSFASTRSLSSPRR